MSDFAQQRAWVTRLLDQAEHLLGEDQAEAMALVREGFDQALLANSYALARRARELALVVADAGGYVDVAESWKRTLDWVNADGDFHAAAERELRFASESAGRGDAVGCEIHAHRAWLVRTVNTPAAIQAGQLVSQVALAKGQSWKAHEWSARILPYLEDDPDGRAECVRIGAEGAFWAFSNYSSRWSRASLAEILDAVRAWGAHGLNLGETHPALAALGTSLAARVLSETQGGTAEAVMWAERAWSRVEAFPEQVQLAALAAIRTLARPERVKAEVVTSIELWIERIWSSPLPPSWILECAVLLLIKHLRGDPASRHAWLDRLWTVEAAQNKQLAGIGCAYATELGDPELIATWQRREASAPEQAASQAHKSGTTDPE